MGSATWKPNSNINPYGSYWSNIGRMYDNDTSSYGSGGSGGSSDTRYLYFQGNVPSAVETAAKNGRLSSISVKITASSLKSAGVSFRMVHGASSDGSSYTDAGDGNKTIYSNGNPSSRNIETHTFSMSSAVGTFNSKGTINDYAVRLSNKNASYGTSSYWLRVYDVSITVEWLNSSTLSVNPNGGTWNSSSSTQTFTQNAGTTKSIPIPTRSGYRFTGWTRTNTYGTMSSTTSAATYTFGATDAVTDYLVANWEVATYTLSFDTHGGNSISSVTKQAGSAFGTLPTPTRAGYEFAGWYKTAPCYNSGKFNGSDFVAISRSYMYTNDLSIHIEAYMSDWSSISSKQQIMSCTEGGGWGIGYQANTTGHGTEIYIDGVGYKGIDFGIANLSSGWHTFDVLFTNGTFSAKVDGVSKGSVATGGTAIKYHASNSIFIGAEAASSASTPGGNYFNGLISSVFIANRSGYLTQAGSSDTSETDVTLHAAWRPIAGPTFTSAQLRYSNEQVSPSNKVLAGQGYIVSIGVM